MAAVRTSLVRRLASRTPGVDDVIVNVPVLMIDRGDRFAEKRDPRTAPRNTAVFETIRESPPATETHD
jgi:hypothetical protein